MPRCIMAIDNAPDILELYHDILTDEGYQVVAYTSASRALAEVEQIAPNLIILAYLLGEGITGAEVIQQLKAGCSTAVIPVILCTTAVNMVQEIEDVLRADGVGIVYKPFQLEKLLECVDQMLQTPGQPC